jgi:tripartite-type tricarboxylate transporter receptor subunit TctC
MARRLDGAFLFGRFTPGRFLIGLLALTALAAPVAAQDYPNRSIRLIIPFPPGGSNDVVGRIVANQLGQKLGKQVFVDNRAGAGGVVGSDLAAKAAPDGYTLLVISIAHAVNPWIYKLPYDPAKDFVPVSIIATGTNVLTVNPSVPVHSVKELLEFAKQKPGELNYASAGIGSFQHLSGELFKLMAGVDIVHVPYKGGGPSMLAVMAGEAQVMFSSIVQTVPSIQSGHLRAIGTGGEQRSPILPDVPTIGEAGVPGYVATNWWGILAPAGTPQPIVDKLHDIIADVLTSPDTKKYLDNEGAAPVRMSAAEFGAFIAAETAKWGPVVKQAGMKAE